jgi:hypothetical protein
VPQTFDCLQIMAGDGIDGNDDDDDKSDFGLDETDLESFSTLLEINEEIDEFQIFCSSLQRTLCMSHQPMDMFDLF